MLVAVLSLWGIGSMDQTSVDGFVVLVKLGDSVVSAVLDASCSSVHYYDNGIDTMTQDNEATSGQQQKATINTLTPKL